MSWTGDPGLTDSSQQQRKRLQGACDMCRRKKIKCDSAMSPDNRCTYCASFGLECTHRRPTKKRGPKNSYISLLESRVASLENAGIYAENEVSRISPSSSDHKSTSLEAVNDSSISVGEDEGLHNASPSDQPKPIPAHMTESTFFGPSSSLALIESVGGLRQEVTGEDSQRFRRDQFWKIHPWEVETAKREQPNYVFPEQSFMASLVFLFFQKFNSIFPVLHAPTFARNIAQGLHLENPYFGAVVLVVCALGARYCDDPRVLSYPDQPLSAGWQWFEQTTLLQKLHFDPTTLYELQFYILSAAFTFGTSSPKTGWYLLGLAMRSALDMGLNRRPPPAQRPTVESEQQKRAFWVLVVLDRLVSGLFDGRPFAVHEDDIDLELPIECDDEYWENVDPDLAFRQPPDKSSYVTSFLALVQLCNILVFAVRRLSLNRKLQPRPGEMEQQAVAEVDSALNDWKSRLPEHLHWDPSGERGIFFEQSGFLRIYYHTVHIQTHWRFINDSSPMSFTSLVICTNAAKSCIRIVDALVGVESSVREFVLFPGFISGCLLLSKFWENKRAGVKTDLKATADVEKLRGALRTSETRFMSAGMFLDLLNSFSGGLEEDDAPTQNAPPAYTDEAGRQEPETGYRFQPSAMSPNPGCDPGDLTAAVNMVPGQPQTMNPTHQTSCDGTYGMQGYPQPATPSTSWYYGADDQPEYRDGGNPQMFGTEMWSTPQLAFEGWSYNNMAHPDLDTMFMPNIPDVLH